MNQEILLLLGGVLLDALFLCLLAWASISDVWKRIIPNIVVILIFLTAICKTVLLATAGSVWWIYPGGLLLTIPFIAFWNRGWMGAGDSKLIGVAGFYLNIYGGLLMLAIFAGWLLITMAFLYFRQIDHRPRVPLAPLISLSAALTMLIGYIPYP
jgi:Flp pilus assembly protein protease CpaA